MVLGTLHSFDVLGDFTALFPDASTISAQGTWRYEFTGTTGSINTGPGTNNMLPFVHTETSGSNPIPDVELRGVAHMGAAAIPSETSRTLHIRACIQGAFGDGVEGLIVRERASDSDPWVVADTIHGWAYGTYSAGEMVTDENGVDRVIAADGGWIDFTIDVADSTTQIELMPEYIVVGNVWVHDIALRSMQWEWPGGTPGTQSLAMSARSGSPTATFALTTVVQPATQQLAMSARAGNPTVSLDLAVVAVSGGYVTGDVLVDTRSSGDSSTLDLPVHSAGDQLIILVGHSYSSSPIAQIPVPTGWTVIREGEAGGTSAVGLAAWAKIGDGSESTATIPAIPAAVPNTVVAIAIAVGGVTNIESAALTMQESGVDIDSPSITPSAIATILRAFVFDDNFSSETDYDSDSNFLGVGVGYGESSSPGNGLSVGFGAEEDAAAGAATGTSTWSSNGDSDAGMALTIALTHGGVTPPTTQQLAMSARGGNPTATFALTTIAPSPPQPGIQSLAMSSRSGSPTARFALTAVPPHQESLGTLTPGGIIVAWPSTVATIPAGWTRVTELDDRYIKGQQGTAEPGDAGGSATHTHTSPEHSHSQQSHDHSGGSLTRSTIVTTRRPWTIVIPVSKPNHTHGISSRTGTNSGDSGGSSSMWGEHASDPKFVRVIWIQSHGPPRTRGIPVGAWLFFNTAARPTGWTHAISPDTRNAFLKGALAAGDGGGIGGGGAHDHTGVHNHPIGTHNHTQGNSLAAQDSYSATTGGAADVSSSDHIHSVSVGDSEDTTSSDASANTASTTYEPSFQKLQIIENSMGSEDLPLEIICLWLGTLNSIPEGWAHCDGFGGTPDLREDFIKGASSLTDLGNTGGSSGHNHGNPAAPHSHQSTDHRHPNTATTAGAGGPGWTGTGVTESSTSHYTGHGGSTGTIDPGVSGVGTKTVDAIADSEPAFRTVAFVQLKDVLTVTIDAPLSAATVLRHDFLIDWSLPGGETQQDYRVQIATDALMTSIIYDSGVVVSTITREETDRFTLPNNAALYISVTCTDTNLLVGSAPIRNVTSSWALPNTVANLMLTPVGGL